MTRIIILFLGLLLVACASSSRVPESQFAFDSGSIKSYWFNTDKGCKVADSWDLDGTNYSWSGQCLNGYVDGCGTLIRSRGFAKMKGCFKQGKKDGEFEVVDENFISKYTYSEGLITKVSETEYTQAHKDRVAKYKKRGVFASAQKCRRVKCCYSSIK